MRLVVRPYVEILEERRLLSASSTEDPAASVPVLVAGAAAGAARALSYWMRKRASSGSTSWPIRQDSLAACASPPAISTATAGRHHHGAGHGGGPARADLQRCGRRGAAELLRLCIRLSRRRVRGRRRCQRRRLRPTLSPAPAPAADRTCASSAEPTAPSCSASSPIIRLSRRRAGGGRRCRTATAAAEIVTGAGPGAGRMSASSAAQAAPSCSASYAYQPAFARRRVRGGRRSQRRRPGRDRHRRGCRRRAARARAQRRDRRGTGSFFAFDGSYTSGVPVAIGNGQVFAGGNPGGTPLARAFTLAAPCCGSSPAWATIFSRASTWPRARCPLLRRSGRRLRRQRLARRKPATWGRWRRPRRWTICTCWTRPIGSASASTAPDRPPAYVRLEFLHAAGDIDLGLYNSAGTLVRRSDGVSNSEQISLEWPGGRRSTTSGRTAIRAFTIRITRWRIDPAIEQRRRMAVAAAATAPTSCT